MRSVFVLLAVIGLASPVYADEPQPAGSSAQQAPRQPELRSFGYARVGYGGAFADRFRSAPAVGLGYRGELDSFALDISFLNYTIGLDPYESSQTVVAGSIVRLQALRFLNPDADRSAYLGGGLSWGSVTAGRGSGSTDHVSGWHGSGLQGEVAAGYELARHSPVRIFVQADIALPFFKATADSFTFERTANGLFRPTSVDERYIPSAVVSLGIGWSRDRHP